MIVLKCWYRDSISLPVSDIIRLFKYRRLIQMNLIYSCELLFSGRRESALWASCGSALAPSAPGRLGYNRDKPLTGCDISALIFSKRGRVELQARPANRAASTYFSTGSVTSTTWPTCHSGLWVATTTAPNRGSAALGRGGRAVLAGCSAG